MGRESKKEGIYVYVPLIHLAVQQKLTQHSKATILQFKKKFFFKKRRKRNGIQIGKIKSWHTHTNINKYAQAFQTIPQIATRGNFQHIHPTRSLLVLKMATLPSDPDGKESFHRAGHLGLIPGLGRSLAKGKGHPLQYSGLENSMDCIVRGVAKSWTWLSNFHFHFQAPFDVCLKVGSSFSILGEQ